MYIYFQFRRETKAFFKEVFLSPDPIQVIGSTYFAIVFRLFISQRYAHTL